MLGMVALWQGPSYNKKIPFVCKMSANIKKKLVQEVLNLFERIVHKIQGVENRLRDISRICLQVVFLFAGEFLNLQRRFRHDLWTAPSLRWLFDDDGSKWQPSIYARIAGAHTHIHIYIYVYIYSSMYMYTGVYA